MNGETMSEQRFIIKNSNTVSSNYPSERVYDNKVKRDLYNSEIVIMLNKLWEENEQLRQFINKGRRLSVKELMDNANENELLKKENEQLRKDKEQLKKRLRECGMRVDKLLGNCR